MASKPATAVSPKGAPRTFTGLRIPTDLLKQVDDFCIAHPLQPSRTKMVELAIREYLAREEIALPRKRA
jgi:metal-responsive CopG/Arc/MetJ family transcriptional regulator